MARVRFNSILFASGVVIFAGALSLAVVSTAVAQDDANPKPAPQAPAEQSDETPLPKRDEMLRNIPSKADLLTKPPTDWIFLQNDDVLVVKPVAPRPRTLAIYADKRKELQKPPKVNRMPGESNDDFLARQRQASEEARKQREKYEFLEVELPDSTKVSEDQDDSSYKLHIEKYVKDILHHEDLVLKRVDLFLEAKQLEDAYDLLLYLDRHNQGWPGYDERLNQLLLLDAQGKFASNEFEPAFVLLEQMHDRVKTAINSKDTSLRYGTMGLDMQKCQAELGKVIDALIEPAVKARDFRQARFHLARLVKLEPEHPDAVKWKDRLVGETNQLLARAAQATSAGKPDEAATLADEAALVWPATPNLKNTHRQFALRWQALRIGVSAVPAAGFPFATEASRRRDGLTRLPLFEPARIDGGARYRSRFLESWEPTDLGRQAIFTLRSGRSSWESSPILTASGAVSALLERLQPESPHYDERLASFVDGIEVRGPFEFAVRFSRIPVRTEALFAFPLGFDEASSAEFDQRFRVHAQTERTSSFRRTVTEPERSLQRHLAEVIEVRYPTPERAVQGLLRGEVSALANAPVWQLDQLAKDARFFVRKYALPQTHFLQFNPKSQALRSAELRRALMYGLDRSQILREVMLRDLTVRTLREPLLKANAPAKLPPESGLSFDEPKGELVWNGLSMTGAQFVQFGNLSSDSEYRKALQSLFRKSQPDRGRVVSAPWATTLAAYNPIVAARESDWSLAFALATAAKKGMGGKLPTLRLICESDPVVESAAQRLVQEWRRADIPVQLVTLPSAATQPPPQARAVNAEASIQLVAAVAQEGAVANEPKPEQAPTDETTWDIVYRTARIAEPMMELWPLLSLDTVARLETIRYLPDWLRQGLIDLDRTADWATTVANVQELHRELAETVQLIPLWEIDDALVVRRTVRGIPDAPLHPYHDVELWISEPWYPTE